MKRYTIYLSRFTIQEFMTNERWLDAVATIKEKFTVLQEGSEAFEDRPGTVAFIVFERKDGSRFRLERATHPVVTGKKTFGSRRIGSTNAVQYEYSPTETTSSVSAYRWDESSGEFQPIEIAAEIFTAL